MPEVREGESMMQSPKERALDRLEAFARTGLLTIAHNGKDIAIEYASPSGKRFKANGETLAECALAIARAVSAKKEKPE